jgi:putative transposase
LPLDIRSWDCPSCDTKSIDRDINAGQNILAAGLAVEVASGRVSRPVYDDRIVCGADVRPNNHNVRGQLPKPRKGRKQKPKS